ncbi:ribbon-helix-helix domain-containing protein [Devosia sp.]|uniref:ribbon-helix-helix domain-containing protein n=1 Tax=Devosia sp. TaxID=1871048 RepID=UPI002FCB88F3
MDKRSLSIAGHRTSIALEPEFWAALEAMAAERAQPMAGLIRDIDENRQTDNLSSAARLAVLRWYQRRIDGG